jgi:hypothetical protein
MDTRSLNFDYQWIDSKPKIIHFIEIKPHLDSYNKHVRVHILVLASTDVRGVETISLESKSQVTQT